MVSEKQTVYKIVNKKRRTYNNKTYYWQKKAAENKAKECDGELYKLTGYWVPADSDENVIYMLFDMYTDCQLGVFTSKAKLVKTVKELMKKDNEDHWEDLTYNKLLEDTGNYYSYYVKEAYLNELF